MTKQEFSKAKQLAEKGETDLSTLDKFVGFGLPDFKQVTCKLAEMAGLISWQARQLNGQWDQDAMQEIFQARRKFVIETEPAPDFLTEMCG